MSNESLEALETIKHCTDLNVAEYPFGFKEEIETIETELKRYKAIEQDLGIDLITLFKALKNGIWVKGYGTDDIVIWYGYYSNSVNIHARQSGFIYVGDYGKNWALTKEELENGTN